MAVETGTAANPSDLYSKLVSFLTTNVDLVAAGQEWTVVWDTPGALYNQTDKVLRGPGLSGQDQVYVGLRLYEDTIGDTFYLECAGMTGVLPTGQHYRDHVNVMPNFVRMFTDVGTVSYWFVANGRRFIVVLKISTTFQTLYAGLFLPYATPLSYPYPMFIGGSAGNTDPDGPFNWRSVGDQHSHFMRPYNGNDYSSGQVDSGAWMIDPAGTWKRVAINGTGSTPVRIAPEHAGDDYFNSRTTGYSFRAYRTMERLMDAYGGDRLLIPMTLVQLTPEDQTYGIIDGAFRCQGVANSAENLITIGGVDHLVVQNVYRTEFDQYWALALE